MKWEYYCQCSLQLKFKQNMYVFSFIYLFIFIWQSTNECAARQTSSRSSVFTPVSPTSKTEILSGKYPVKFYRIAEFYRILISGSGTSLVKKSGESQAFSPTLRCFVIQMLIIMISLFKCIHIYCNEITGMCMHCTLLVCTE